MVSRHYQSLAQPSQLGTKGQKGEAREMISDGVDLTKLFNPNLNAPVLTDIERRKAKVMIVDADHNIRNTLRQALVSLGFMTIADAPDPAAALQKLNETDFTHVIFDVRRGQGAAKDFLTAILELDDRIVAIPSSVDPTIDDVFDLLLFGARSYLVKPFTSGTLDESICWASKGEPISDSILYAKSRNEALASLILTTLDKLAIIMGQSRHFETARRELPRRNLVFRRAVDVAKTFAQGGEAAVLGQLVQMLLIRSHGPAKRLGGARRKIPGRRQKGQSEKGPRASGAYYVIP